MKKIITAGAVWALPLLALAAPYGTQVTATNTTFSTIVIKIANILNSVLPIVLALGVIVFLWGVVQYMTAGADEEKRDGARNLMIYGIIGLFVMVSIWGLVGVVGKTFGVGSGGSAPAPRIPTEGIR